MQAIEEKERKIGLYYTIMTLSETSYPAVYGKCEKQAL
jgi:hypothetical protein